MFFVRPFLASWRVALFPTKIFVTHNPQLLIVEHSSYCYRDELVFRVPIACLESP